MILGKRQRIVASSLGFSFKTDNPRSRWWLRDEGIVPMVRCVFESMVGVASGSFSQMPSNIRILKHNDRKHVWLVEQESASCSPCVAKLFFLKRLRNRLKYYKYALDEAAGLLTASSRGLNTPRVYGYGHIYGSFGLVQAGVVLMKALSGYATIESLMQNERLDESARAGVMRQAIPLIVRLYHAGCNHIDLNCGAIMVPDNIETGKGGSREMDSCQAYILDMQHARFHDAPSREILMFEAAYFARACTPWVGRDVIMDWLSRLLDEVEVRDGSCRAMMHERFMQYLSLDLSRKERKSIRPFPSN